MLNTSHSAVLHSLSAVITAVCPLVSSPLPTRSRLFPFHSCPVPLNLLVLLVLLATSPQTSLLAGYNNRSNNNHINTVSLRIALKPDAYCQGNLIRLTDIVDMQGSEAARQTLEKIHFGPAPQPGKSLEITRSDVQKQLQLRGMQANAFHWAGSDRCFVRRGHPTPTQTPVQSASFTSTRTTPTVVRGAERNVEAAIRTYLKLQDEQSHAWRITVQVPELHAKLLNDRRSIVGIGGGEAPWEGEQSFIIQAQGPDGEVHIDIPSTIAFPQMVVGSKRAKRAGQVITADDLILMPLSPNAKFTLNDCFVDPGDLIGQELRRAASTNQVFVRTDVGPPRVIEAGQIVEVEVLSGGVSVTTAAKSLQAGGIGETIQVEIIPHKKKLMAHVIDEKRVRVIASSP